MFHQTLANQATHMAVTHDLRLNVNVSSNTWETSVQIVFARCSKVIFRKLCDMLLFVANEADTYFVRNGEIRLGVNDYVLVATSLAVTEDQLLERLREFRCLLSLKSEQIDNLLSPIQNCLVAIKKRNWKT